MNTRRSFLAGIAALLPLKMLGQDKKPIYVSEGDVDLCSGKPIGTTDCPNPYAPLDRQMDDPCTLKDTVQPIAPTFQAPDALVVGAPHVHDFKPSPYFVQKEVVQENSAKETRKFYDYDKHTVTTFLFDAPDLREASIERTYLERCSCGLVRIP